MDLTIAQWNVWGREKAEYVLKGLRRLKADIYCLQELSANTEINPNIEVARFVQGTLGLYCYFQPARCLYSRQGIEQHGSAILSRFPITWATSLPVKEAGDTSVLYDPNPRTYLEVDAKLPCGKLTVGCTHLSYTPGFRHEAAKQPENNRLLAILKGKKQRFVLAMDSNSLPGSPTMQAIKRVLKDCGPRANENTWTRVPQAFPDSKVEELIFRIDWILASPDIKVLSARTFDTGFSDHLAVVCKIQL